MLPRGGEACCDVLGAVGAGGEERNCCDKSRPFKVDIAWSEGKDVVGIEKSAARGCAGCLWRGAARASI